MHHAYRMGNSSPKRLDSHRRSSLRGRWSRPTFRHQPDLRSTDHPRSPPKQRMASIIPSLLHGHLRAYRRWAHHGHYNKRAEFLHVECQHQTDRPRFILAVGTFYAIVSFLPIPLVIGGLVLPRKTRVEKFGSGRFRTKIAILLAASFLLCLGASFRVGTNFKTPKPIQDPPTYYNKGCFYFFNLTVEVIVIFLYVVVRVDRRFHVPNGSKGPGDYSGRNTSDEKDGHIATRIKSEEEVFDNAPKHDSAEKSDGDQRV